jgi:enoyl-CoA hydratase/carnithine racemase
MPLVSPPMSYETILVSKHDGVATVALNRPAVRNAINQQMQAALHEVWHGFRYDDDVRCVVLAGEGDAFCTGIERAEAISDDNNAAMAAGDFPGYPTPWMYDDPGRDVGPKSCDLWKPVIAAVQGMACGGAFYMLGEVEFIIAAEDATFFDPHVTYGMTAAFEPIQMLSKMPFHEIMRLSLLGVHERMSVERAREIGLVSEVVAATDLRDRAVHVARIIADSPPLAIQGTMRALWTALEVPRTQAIGLANLFTRIGSDAASFKAGQDRFASGERPKWELR